MSGAGLFFCVGLLALLGVFGPMLHSSPEVRRDWFQVLERCDRLYQFKQAKARVESMSTFKRARLQRSEKDRNCIPGKCWPMSIHPAIGTRNGYEELFVMSLFTEPKEAKDDGQVAVVRESLPQFHDVKNWQDMPKDDFDSCNMLVRRKKGGRVVVSNVLSRSDYDGDITEDIEPDYARIPSRRSKASTKNYLRFPKRVFAAAVAATRWSETMKRNVIAYKYGGLDRPATDTERIYAWRTEVCIRRALLVREEENQEAEGEQYDRNSDYSTGTASADSLRDDGVRSARSVRTRRQRRSGLNGSPSPEPCDARTASA